MRINSVVLNVFVLIYKLNIVLVTSSSKIDQLHAANLPPCRACRTLVDSFNKVYYDCVQPVLDTYYYDILFVGIGTNI